MIRRLLLPILPVVMLLLDGECRAKVPSAVPAAEVEVPELPAPFQADVGYEDVVQAVFDSSLEMRENVDCLLTPAFMFQELLSNDVVTTYPNE